MALTTILWIFSAFATSKIQLRVAGNVAGLTLVAIAFGFAMVQLPYLGDKIAEQYDRTVMRGSRFESTRFGSIVYDWKFISQRPLIGWTAAERPRQEVDPSFRDIYATAGNGFSGFTSRFGIPATVLFFLTIYINQRRGFRTRIQSGLFALILLTLLQGGQFLSFPVFWCLTMYRTGPQRVAETISGDERLRIAANAR